MVQNPIHHSFWNTRIGAVGGKSGAKVMQHPVRYTRVPIEPTLRRPNPETAVAPVVVNSNPELLSSGPLFEISRREAAVR